jgi:hypothetical protein
MLAFYADESGTAKLHTQSPWYVFLAVGFDDKDWKRIEDSVVALKHRYFPGWKPHLVEIHSNDIRRARLQSYPPNPFSTLSAETLKAFTDDLYDLINRAPIEWCATVVNKPEAIRRYGIASAPELFQLAYLRLMERLHGWCKAKSTQGRLFVDQQELNLLGGAFHELVEEGHFRLQERGTGWQRTDNIIERPYFIDSCRSHHMQLADVLAYNVYRRFQYDDPAYPFFVRTIQKVRGNIRPDGGYYGLHVCPP